MSAGIVSLAYYTDDPLTYFPDSDSSQSIEVTEREAEWIRTTMAEYEKVQDFIHQKLFGDD